MNELDGVSPTQIISRDGSILVRGSGAVDLSSGGGFVIPPGPDSAEETIAAIAAGATVIRYLEGVYEWDQPVPLPSDVTLIGQGSDLTLIHASFAGVGDDDPENAMVLVQGVLDPASLNTVLTVHARPDAETVTTAVAGSVAAGDWIALIGHNDPAQEVQGISSGSSTTLTEIAQVLSAGPVFTLSGNLLQNHTITNGGVGTAQSVQAVVPVRNVHIQGVTFDAAGGSIANAILYDFAENVSLYDVGFEGFSRSCVEPRLGTRNFRFDEIRRIGETNSIFLMSSCMAGRISNVHCDPDGLRFHAGGIPRGFFNSRNRPTNIVVQTCELKRGCVGIRNWSGTRISYEDVLIADFNVEEARWRDPEMAGSVQGVGVDSGAGPVAINETSLNIAYTNVHCFNCRHASVALNATWYFHDLHQGMLTNCSIQNDGLSPSTAGRLMTGLYCQDISGTIDGFYISGVEEGIRLTGGELGMLFSNIFMNGVAGFGVGLVGIRVNYGPAIGPPRFNRCLVNNYAFPIFFDTVFDGDPDYAFGFDVFGLGSTTEYHDVLVALNATGVALVPGDIVELDPASPTGTRQIINTTGANGDCAVVVTPISIGLHGLICVLPTAYAVVNSPAGVIAVGAFIVANAANQAIAVAPPAVHLAIGKCIIGKGAGAGVITIGPVT